MFSWSQSPRNSPQAFLFSSCSFLSNFFSPLTSLWLILASQLLTQLLDSRWLYGHRELSDEQFSDNVCLFGGGGGGGSLVLLSVTWKQKLKHNRTSVMCNKMFHGDMLHSCLLTPDREPKTDTVFFPAESVALNFTQAAEDSESSAWLVWESSLHVLLLILEGRDLVNIQFQGFPEEFCVAYLQFWRTPPIE